MSVPWPRCGDEKPHPAHQDSSGHGCPGWKAEQQLVRHLIMSVRKYVNENYSPVSTCPAGLRVEMQPAVQRMLMTDPDLWEHLWERPGRETALDDFFPVPVRVDYELKQQWRLVIVTEKVLLAGTMPEKPVSRSDEPAKTGSKKIPFYPDVIYDPEHF